MPCPEIDQLEQFASDALDESSKEWIRRHLPQCPECESRLSEVSENLRVAGSVRRAIIQTSVEAAPAAVPKRIGPYRILRPIGRGGMGRVYEAEQERPRRRVALKVVAATSASDQMLRRFEHESQILGRLQHPGIAQVFEAGTADAGAGVQPWFAMELIEGPSLREFARRHNPTVRTRLELIAAICDAVHHAHQKGVIHRDLKPSNILIAGTGLSAPPQGSSVSSVSLAPQPKVLDFGVARLTESDMLATRDATIAGQLIGTIPYMSPEQVAGDPADLDTRSDVYALGVIAFELLSGRLPHDAANRPLPELARSIQEEEPVSLAAVDRSLSGDVATIVAKALEKDRERRYQSAAEMADDIRRYLADQPINARPPTAAYQLSKFARRHRALVGGVAATTLALVAGTVFSTWQALRANRAEQDAQARFVEAKQAKEAAQASLLEAQRDAKRFATVNEFLEEMLAAADPDKSPGQAPSVRDMLDRAAAQLDEGSLRDQPEIEAGVRTTIGNAYRGLGDFAAGEPHLWRAVEIGRAQFPDGHTTLAYSLNKLGRLLQSKGDYDGAESAFREALDMRRRLLGDEHVDVAIVLGNLGWLRYERGDYAEAEELQRQSLEMRRRLQGPQDTGIATALNNLAITLYATGRLEPAIEMFRESLAMDRKLRGDHHPNVASTMGNLATLLNEMARFDEAESLLRESLRLQRETVGDEHPNVATTLNNLALMLKDRGRLDEAEPLLREALAMERKLRGPDHPNVANTMSNLSSLLMRRGEYEEADALVTGALEIRRRHLGETHPLTLNSLYHLSGLHLARKQCDEAEAAIGLALDGAGIALPENHWHIGVFLARRAECLLCLDRPAEAIDCLRQAVGLLEPAIGPGHDHTQRAYKLLAEACDATGAAEEAAGWRARLATAETPQESPAP